jgi:dihydrofolate reductase
MADTERQTAGGKVLWHFTTSLDGFVAGPNHRIGLEAAGGKNLEVFSATIGRQLLERGLIDEIDLHIAPVLLGDGIRLFDNLGGAPVRLELLNGDDHSAAVNVRYHPVATR